MGWSSLVDTVDQIYSVVAKYPIKNVCQGRGMGEVTEPIVRT